MKTHNKKYTPLVFLCIFLSQFLAINADDEEFLIENPDILFDIALIKATANGIDQTATVLAQSNNISNYINSNIIPIANNLPADHSLIKNLAYQSFEFVLDYKNYLQSLDERAPFGQDDAAAIATINTIITESTSLEATCTTLLTTTTFVGDDVKDLHDFCTQIKTTALAGKLGAAVDKLEIELRILQYDSLFAATEEAKNEALSEIPTKQAAIAEAKNEFDELHSNVANEQGNANVANPAIDTLVSNKAQLYKDAITASLNNLNQSQQFRDAICQKIINYVLQQISPEIQLIAVGYSIIQWASENMAFGNATADTVAEWSALKSKATEATSNPMIITRDAYISSQSSIDLAVSTIDSISFAVGEDAIIGLSNSISGGAILAGTGESLYNQQLGKMISTLETDISQGIVPSCTADGTNQDEADSSGMENADTTYGNPEDTAAPADQVEESIANGAVLVVSGNNDGFSQLRELVLNSYLDKLSSQLTIFADKSARIALGTQTLSNNTGQTINVLGNENGAQIIVNGNAFIDINSDLFIEGNNSNASTPFLPTENFGKDAEHRLVLTSPVERQIIITRGTTWDLTAFGKGNTPNGQQIMFDGNIKLILEPGASIRFPYIPYGNESLGPIVYMNGSSELIVLGTENRDEVRWNNATGSNAVRCKFKGVGALWLNKEAQMSVNNMALFGIESDNISPRTDITISLQRYSALKIGSETTSGGGFQVGNQTKQVSQSINFKLLINGPSARTEIHRSGFFGIGAGTINKAANPNGNTPDSSTDPAGDVNQYYAWRIQSLHNVKNFLLDLQQGIFQHNNIFDGSNEDASLMVIGSIEPTGNYTVKLGKIGHAIIRGGGNIMYIDNSILPANPLIVNIWNTATAFSVEGSNNGKLSLLAPDVLFRSRVQNIQNTTGSQTVQYGRAYISLDSEKYHFAGPQEEFFTAFTMKDYATDEPFLPVGYDDQSVYTGFVINETIKRRLVTFAQDSLGTDADPELAIAGGYFIGARNSSSGEPISFMVPE